MLWSMSKCLCIVISEGSTLLLFLKMKAMKSENSLLLIWFKKLGFFLTAVGSPCIELEKGVKTWQGSPSALVHFHFSCLARNYLDLAGL